MRDQSKWNVTIGRFAGFVSNLPAHPNQNHISQYHHILKSLEDASGQNLSQFRIAPDQVKPAVASAVTALREGHSHPRHSGKSLVEFASFKAQVRGLMDFLDHQRKREELKIKRELLFQKFAKNPGDIQLSLAIKAMDDQIAEPVRKLHPNRGSHT